ncbi:calmodulin [Plasmodium cynomolgi strain B]|uniref:Calmodulin n=1 Tax=Plasmodium cynomolgi (strain B) TaxID=1120755 RepID=K6V198_PLACD|nr:calmodulin [Plasmodium cynomolgi strain B]GAB68890.1 calmodulin [Plasmodium cynomolgi strain B]
MHYTLAGFCSLLGSLLRCSGYNVSLKEIDKIKDKIVENKIKEKSSQVNEKRETEITTNEKDANNDTSNHKQAETTNVDDDDNDNSNNISKMLSDLKNYDNFIELEKQKEEKKKKEENKNLFSIKEFFRIIHLPNITNETKPSNVLNSFEIFDEKGNGRISIKKLRFILQYLGEPLSNADFDEFFDWIKTVSVPAERGGREVYMNFCVESFPLHRVMSTAPCYTLMRCDDLTCFPYVRHCTHKIIFSPDRQKDKVYKKDYIIYEDLLNELVNKDTSV